MKSRLLVLLVLAAALAVAAGCGSDEEGGASSGPTGTGASAAPEPCAKENLELVNPGKLTIATSNPSFPPWFIGPGGGPWDPTSKPTHKGFEAGVAYGVAKQLGFSDAEVQWEVVGFDQSYAPGPKNYDFTLQQIEYTPKRARAVDFSDSYLDLHQALVAAKTSDIANATSIADLKDAKLGAPVGTTSYDYIVNTIKPSQDPAVYNTQNDAVAALKANQIDGIVVDLPTAFYITAAQAPGSKIVGQFPAAGEGGHFGLVLEKGSSLTPCLNQALAKLRDDGTLASLEQKWLQADAPVLK